MTNLIKNALLKLDPANDDHWTDDGLPRIDVVTEFAGKSVKRAEINKAFPNFSRQDSVITEADEDPVGLEDAEQSILACEKEIEEQEAILQSAQNRLRTLQNKRDALILASNKQQPAEHIQNQLSIIDYIESQQRIRDERAEKIKEQAIVPLKAPIDAVMARKTGYGKHRPQVGVLKEG